MSMVTNVILTWPLDEEGPAGALKRIGDVNEAIRGRGFVHADADQESGGWYGGTKFLECNVAIGAFNYLNLDRLIEHMRTLDWEEPDDVQLFVKEQEDITFRALFPCRKEAARKA